MAEVDNGSTHRLHQVVTLPTRKDIVVAGLFFFYIHNVLYCIGLFILIQPPFGFVDRQGRRRRRRGEGWVIRSYVPLIGRVRVAKVCTPQ